MKKITILVCLLISSLGFSQTNLEDFEGTPSLTGFEGLGGANVVANPSVDANNGSATAGELIVTQAGNPWQGANLIMQSNYIDVSDPATNTVDVDVYSTTSFTMLARLAGGQNGATDSAADAAHSGSGWETLTFTFNENLDNTGSANGEYDTIAFFPNWTGSGWNDPEIEITVYIDNITGTQGAAIAAPDPAPVAAPIPTSTDGNTYSIYNDTNGYTTFLGFDYNFGSLDGEPNLDTGGGTNLALKFDFTVAGYGVGEGAPDDVSVYNFVSFDYYAAAGVPGFRLVMIDNDGAVGEFVYEVGTDEAVANETWTKVVIPMSFFTNLGFDNTALFQWKMDPFMQSVAQGGIVYVDNILLTVGNPLSVDSFETTQLNVYPNPASDVWNVSSSATITNVAVFDILGKQVLSIAPNSNEATLDASSLRTGVYFARLEGINGSKTIKLVKE